MLLISKGELMLHVQRLIAHMKQNGILLVMGCFWLGLIVLGETSLLKYDFRPGIQSNSPEVWPSDSRIEHSDILPTLVLFAHPKCPCTRASIGELAKLIARSQGKLSVQVLFTVPKNASNDWLKTDLWGTAVHIPGVHVTADMGGEEATRFNATTSGQTILYDPQGRLLFSGGITNSRGHFGDNRGRALIESFLAGEASFGPVKRTPIFGCFLVQPKSNNVPRSPS